MVSTSYPTMFFTARSGRIHTFGLVSPTTTTVGEYLQLELDAVGTTGSPFELIIPEDGWITDLVLGTGDHPATGQIELISNSKRTGITFNLANHGISNTCRPKLLVPLRKVTEIRIMATNTLGTGA